VSFVNDSSDGFVGCLLGHKLRGVGGWNIKNKGF